MKNLSLILNIILLVAVAILYFFHFSENNSKDIVADTENASSIDISNLKVAYVNSDSLVANFEFYKEKAVELKNERLKSENALTSRAKGIEKQVADFQQTAGNMTINQARAIEEDLVKKQQNLLQYRENLTQSLLKKESEINNELYEKISDYMKQYGVNNKLEIVLSYSRNSGVLFADDGLDITQVVINGLNESYRNENIVKSDSLTTN